MATDETKMGQVVEVIGPVVDVQFEEQHLPAIHNAVRITSEGFDVPEPLDIVAEVEQHLGEGRVRAVAMKPTEGMVRGMKADRPGRADYSARGPRDARARAERARRAGRQLGPGEDRQALSDSSPGAVARRSVHQSRNVRDRHQGRRPDRAVSEGRKDRPLRRRGRRQDRSDSGTDSTTSP